MKRILLTRKSSFQIYCANILFKNGYLTDVIVEGGDSFVSNSKKMLFKKAIKIVRIIIEPLLTIQRLMNSLNFNKYYGNQRYHNKRILGGDYQEFEAGLNVYNIKDINSDEAFELLQNISPDFVWVFGTRMISKRIIESIKCPMINMHWGWSPVYRGEGIVTALGIHGSGDLGVTVHHLDEKSDSGPIIYRERPKVDKEDNFFSIGLKLTCIGTRLFLEAIRAWEENKELPGQKQDLAQGKLYGKKYMRRHPELLSRAWKRLKSELDR